MLTAAEFADSIDQGLTKLGYHRLHRSSDAANFLRGDERDPCETLDELLVVVEALCSDWPSRPTFAGMPPGLL